ncbi:MULTISPECIES: exonuclease/endonuclease/phosphatase family protein [Streptomyces]|uniref:endonuclease/exonuclease/phosphatase family protein n=1 Tax=Streptomyces TaxID=1883 RepID=UPI001BAEED31|nr:MULTISPECIES: endonuclease/exonuclease/phosphatase family protein [Streptomyces]MCX4573497.1 endonuclease/exonuclease/phosphatase family protein [Streptomyces sp. NBC_01571]QUW85666.1 endonuclease/exonuclease/phosphatase family protein [Streptomyces mirabilis]
MLINAAICNFENNGGGDRALWQRMHDKLASLDLHLLLRQEVWNAQDDGNALADAAEAVLGMAGLIGPECCTALYHDTNLFTPVGEFPKTGPMWVLPPTVRSLQLAGTAPGAVPLIVGSYHLNYGSTTTRLSEAERLTQWNDRWVKVDGRRVHYPALLGGDNNSYPVPGTPGDPALPVLEEIPDKPHRAHRSYIGLDNVRRMDDRPDDTLRTAGLQDVARHLATTAGNTAAVAPTVDAYETHGPDSRIDRIYASKQLLPAVREVEVINMKGLSDHHTVVVRLDRDTLTNILNNPISRTA